MKPANKRTKFDNFMVNVYQASGYYSLIVGSYPLYLLLQVLGVLRSIIRRESISGNYDFMKIKYKEAKASADGQIWLLVHSLKKSKFRKFVDLARCNKDFMKKLILNFIKC